MREVSIEHGVTRELNQSATCTVSKDFAYLAGWRFIHAGDREHCLDG